MNIPCQNMEIEQIYTQILSGGARSIAICSANAGEGTTSILVALAQRSLLAGHSTLMVDLNLYHPSFKTILPLTPSVDANDVDSDDHRHDDRRINTREISLLNQPLISPQLITITNTGLAMTGITAPHGREHIIKLRQPGALEIHIKEWQSQYDIVLIDTPPINHLNAQNIPAQRISAACDGALLVVLAGQTTEEMVSSAMQKLNSSDVHLLGCIYNDQHNASLKNELLRQLHRFEGHVFDGYLGGLLRPIKKFIKNNEILKLDI
jgi:protein-tyrosine kinase